MPTLQLAKRAFFLSHSCAIIELLAKTLFGVFFLRKSSGGGGAGSWGQGGGARCEPSQGACRCKAREMLLVPKCPRNDPHPSGYLSRKVPKETPLPHLSSDLSRALPSPFSELPKTIWHAQLQLHTVPQGPFPPSPSHSPRVQLTGEALRRGSVDPVVVHFNAEGHPFDSFLGVFSGSGSIFFWTLGFNGGDFA